MAIDLQDGFRIGDCTIVPARNLVRGPDGDAHLEPKAMEVLVVLAEQAGEVVTREQLLDAVWPKTYSGDAALTRCVSLLRTGLQEVGAGKEAIETIPKRGYRLRESVEALPGHVPSTDPPEAKEPKADSPERAGSKGYPWIVGLVVVGLSIGLWHLLTDRALTESALTKSSPEAEEPAMTRPAAVAAELDAQRSIAVLPFANLSGDSADQFFSDGIAEEILNVLGQLPGLSVTSRSSSFAFRGRDLPLTEISGQLGVSNVLEGSVRQWDDRIRISVQLIDAKRDVLLWSETYDRELDNLFAVQSDIARSVAETLKIALDLDSPDASRLGRLLPPIAPEAHAAYLRGIYLMAQRSKIPLEDAAAAFEQALAIEDEFPEAMAQLAITYLLLNHRNYGDLSEAESLAKAEYWSERAIQLAPGLAESQASAGFAAWRGGRAPEAEVHFLRALDINPNYALVWHWLGMMQFRNLSKYEASYDSIGKARRLDPISIPSFTTYMQMLIGQGRFDEARTQMEKFKPVSIVAYHRMRGELEAVGGNWANLLLANLDALRIDPNLNRPQFLVQGWLGRLGLGDGLAEAGPVDMEINQQPLASAEQSVTLAEAGLADDPDSVWSQQSLARALVAAGELERAKPLLEGLWEQSGHIISTVGNHFLTYSDGMALYQVRQDDGDVQGAEAVLEAFDRDIANARRAGITTSRRASSPDFIDGFVRYSRGQRREGLELVKKAVSEGFFIRLEGPFLREMASDPDFEPIRQLHLANVARERKRLLSVVCNDDAYKGVWTPRESDCR